MASVFVGGCTLAAVEAVCDERDDGAGRVMEGVASLLDKSLLYQMEQRGEPYLVMLETLREFGLECLGTTGELERAQQAPAVYYLALAEEAAPSGAGPSRSAGLNH